MTDKKTITLTEADALQSARACMLEALHLRVEWEVLNEQTQEAAGNEAEALRKDMVTCRNVCWDLLRLAAIFSGLWAVDEGKADA